LKDLTHLNLTKLWRIINEKGIGAGAAQKKELNVKIAFLFNLQWKRYKIRMLRILGIDSKSCQISIIHVGDISSRRSFK